MPEDSAGTPLSIAFVVAALFGVLVFVFASLRLPLQPALVVGGIVFLVAYFVAFFVLWLTGDD